VIADLHLARRGGEEATTQAALSSNILRQQTKLHALFAGYGISDLSVDGISGPLTGQPLCAARLGLGMGADTTFVFPTSTGSRDKPHENSMS
jgi:hypothetical protein